MKRVREFLVAVSLIVAILNYIAFIVFRIISGEWFWEPLGYLALGAYIVYEVARMFSKEYEEVEMIVMKCLLAFNFIPMI